METILLETKEQLAIFMNPQRQRLLRLLDRSAAPRTPKDLSLEMGVSASAVQHHLKRLESLGLVRVERTAPVHGILAKYYASTRVTVRLGGRGGEPLANERATMLKSLVADVLDGTLKDIFASEQPSPLTDVMTGVVFLTPENAKKLERLIHAFTAENGAPTADGKPWEYALFYHPAERRV